MLLHEIVKYPSLELVVGLEIDQKVTRGAFKHFGVQPLWDNEKVQWWYGDASKRCVHMGVHMGGRERTLGCFSLGYILLSKAFNRRSNERNA